METEYQKAIGKSIGEVVCDIAEFLELPCAINLQDGFDLRDLFSKLSMAEQLTFALLAEAYAQGWTPEAAEAFCMRAIAPAAGEEKVAAIAEAFRDRTGDDFRIYDRLYGNRFSLLDGSYWSTCLAIGMDAQEVDKVLHYLRLFTIVLVEFAYMENRNPGEIYAWAYYESFRQMLDNLMTEPEPMPDPLPLKVVKIGGSAGKRDGDTYLLSLGVDIQNPSTEYMARDIALNITLKDKNGNVITHIKDQLKSLDPDTTYHYGVTRKIRGEATANIAASAKAESHLKLSTPIMKHLKLSGLRFSREEEALVTNCKLSNEYGIPLSGVVLHYQLLDETGKIIGGSGEWLLDGVSATDPTPITSKIDIPLPGSKKILYSTDFDALDLLKES